MTRKGSRILQSALALFLIFVCLHALFIPAVAADATDVAAVSSGESMVRPAVQFRPTGDGVQLGDHLWFGIPDAGSLFDGYWRILDPDSTNMGTPGAFLLLENLAGTDEGMGQPFWDKLIPDGNEYRGSDAQAWCQAFWERRFTAAEQAAVLPTTKSDEAFVKEHVFDFGQGEPFTALVHFDPVSNILDGDRMFLLSAEEASSAGLGFPDHASRIATFDGDPANWWLRSPHDPSFPVDVGFVFESGWLLDFIDSFDYAVDDPIGMRPAFNLDWNQVVLLSCPGGKSGTTGSLAPIPDTETSSWKLTLLDSGLGGFAASLTSEASEADTAVSLSWTGAVSVDNAWISAVLVGADGILRAYGRLVQPQEAAGTCTVDLSGLAVEPGDTLAVFQEICREDMLPDTGSLPVSLALPEAVLEAAAATEAVPVPQRIPAFWDTAPTPFGTSPARRVASFWGAVRTIVLAVVLCGIGYLIVRHIRKKRAKRKAADT